MQRILFLASILLLVSCHNSELAESGTKKPYDFDFSYDSGWGTSYSLKFTNGDTLFLGNGRRDKSYNIGSMNWLQRKKLDSFIIAFSKQKWNTAYVEDNVVDQHSYQFHLATDTSLTKVFVYGDIAPRKLQIFRIWLIGLIDEIKFHQIDTIIKFESTDNFYPPIVPPPKTR